MHGERWLDPAQGDLWGFSSENLLALCVSHDKPDDNGRRISKAAMLCAADMAPSATLYHADQQHHPACQIMPTLPPYHCFLNI